MRDCAFWSFSAPKALMLHTHQLISIRDISRTEIQNKNFNHFSAETRFDIRIQHQTSVPKLRRYAESQHSLYAHLVSYYGQHSGDLCFWSHRSGSLKLIQIPARHMTRRHSWKNQNHIALKLQSKTVCDEFVDYIYLPRHIYWLISLLYLLLSGRHFGFVCFRLFERSPEEFPSITLAVLGGSNLLQKNIETSSRVSQNPSSHYVNHRWFTVNRRLWTASGSPSMACVHNFHLI